METDITIAEFLPVTAWQSGGNTERGRHDQRSCFWDFRPRDPYLRKEKKRLEQDKSVLGELPLPAPVGLFMLCLQQSLTLSISSMDVFGSSSMWPRPVGATLVSDT